jgi:hypothetical protein
MYKDLTFIEYVKWHVSLQLNDQSVQINEIRTLEIMMPYFITYIILKGKHRWMVYAQETNRWKWRLEAI